MHGVSDRIRSANLPADVAQTLLTHLNVGQRARVLGFLEDTDYNHQLRRLGVIPGTEFEVIRKAPLGDPIEISLRGYSLALRPLEASTVSIQIIA